jgi:hypothetical protein
MPNTIVPALLTEAEAASYLSCSRIWLRVGRCHGQRQNHAETPPFIRASSRMIRYKREDLDAWISAHRCEPQPVPEA